MRHRRWDGALVIAAMVLLLPGCRASSYRQMSCAQDSRQNILHLVAQAVPSSTFIPCIQTLPPGWSYGGSEVRSGFVRFWIDSDRVGVKAVEVTMTRSCDVAGDAPLPLDADDTDLRGYEEPSARHPSITVRHYVFPGGCVTVRYSFTQQAAPTVFAEAQNLLGADPRSSYARDIKDETGLSLCGAGTPPCPG